MRNSNNQGDTNDSRISKKYLERAMGNTRKPRIWDARII